MQTGSSLVGSSLAQTAVGGSCMQIRSDPLDEIRNKPYEKTCNEAWMSYLRIPGKNDLINLNAVLVILQCP